MERKAPGIIVLIFCLPLMVFFSCATTADKLHKLATNSEEIIYDTSFLKSEEFSEIIQQQQAEGITKAGEKTNLNNRVKILNITDDASLKVYELICSDKKVLRTPLKKIRVFIPPLRKGVAIDEATGEQKGYLERAEKFINHFFQSYTDKDNVSPLSAAVFLQYNTEDLIPQYTSTVGSRDSYTLVKFPDNTDRITLLPSSIYYEIYCKNANIFSWSGDCRLNKNETSATFSKVSDKYINTTIRDKDVKMYPIMKIGLTDLSVLIRNYTFIMPSDVLKTDTGADNATFLAFMELGGAKEIGVALVEQSIEKQKSQTKSPSNAIRSRNEIWERYFKTFTKVRRSSEPVTKENWGIIDYEIALDMNIFCKYGVPISSLVVQ